MRTPTKVIVPPWLLGAPAVQVPTLRGGALPHAGRVIETVPNAVLTTGLETFAKRPLAPTILIASAVGMAVELVIGTGNCSVNVVVDRLEGFWSDPMMVTPSPGFG